MALALCLTLLPAPAWAAEDTPEGGAPAVSEQVGTNEEENGAEGDPQNTATPDTGGAEDSKADAPESGEDENAGNNADAAVSAVQTMIGALPTVSELDGMTADELDAAYDNIQAAYDAYEALKAEQQAQITGADCFEALLGWFSSQTAPLADAQSGKHTHCVCGKGVTINGHDSHSNVEFQAWENSNSLPTSGAYYLTQDVTISSSVTLTGDVTLCLHGCTVNVSSGGINVVGGTFTLTDCADQQGTIQGNGKLGVGIHANEENATDKFDTASFVMYGGKLTGFSNAVKVGSMYSLGRSCFTMYGGSITGNNTNSGAAVSGLAKSTHVGDNLPTSVITMYGGEISGNTGEAGGGVYIGDNCTFTLAGGKISGNTASGRTNKNPTISGQHATDGGGGVYLDSYGKFNMTGGEISGNTATGNGGGVCVMTYMTGYNPSITGGKITENTASGGTACGGGIYGGPAKLTIKNTEISGNKCAGSGGGIFANQPLTLEGVQITNNTANTANQGSEGGGVKLGGDDKNFKDYDALTVSGKTSISDNSPNNYYVDRSCLLPIKVSGALDENARIGICMNPAYDTDSKFLPTDGKDSVVATAEGMTLSAANFFPDSYNSDYVVRTDTSGGVKFGLCEHVVPEGSNVCSKCGTKFVAVLEPTDTSAKKGYFSDLSNGATFDNMTGTLKLLQDVTLSGSIITMREGTPTLDLNGHTINGGAHFNLDGTAVLTVIDSSADTTNRMLNVNFYVDPGCTLNLYDGKNKQGFQGTVAFVELKSTGKLVSCGGKIEQLDLRPSNDYNVRLWQSNTQYCTVGIIRVASLETIKVSDFLKKNHPGAMLYGTKSGSAAAERISGNTTINKDGVDGGSYTNLYLQTCEKHEPKSTSNLTCKNCGAELVVKITAMKGKTEQVGYFAEASKDKGTWSSGYAEAAAQLTEWVAEGCTDAKLFPLNDNAYYIPVTCKMTLVGTGRKYINVTVKDGAKLLLEGGEYEKITVKGGEATIPDVTCDGVTVNGGKATLRNVTCADRYGVNVTGGEAILEGGIYNGNFIMKDGTVTVKDGVTFTKNYNLAFQVEKGTLNVEGGTITGGVSIENPVNLTISGGTFKQAVTITRYDDSTTGTCSISGGTFENKLTLYKSAHNLSALLAKGYAYYRDNAIVSGEATELTNVTVKNGHTHIIDADTGECSQCHEKMKASVTVDNGEPTYYETIGAAVTALNAADGAKTLKLFQKIDNSSEIYTLTNGPVTLDLNGKEFWGKPFIAKGITLTLKSEKAGGSVAVVQAVGKDSKIIANSTNIENDGNLTVREISAKEGGRLELSAGTFLDLYVVKDGSSASLSGGLYQPGGYPYGGGPEDKAGTTGKYVGAWDLLPKGYRYKEKKEDGSFSWVFNNSSKISTNKTYTVADSDASFEKIYPDSKTDFTGGTYVVTANETGGSLTLTAKVTSPGKAQYDWRVMYQKADGTTGWDTVGGSHDPNKDKATYTGQDAATLTISNLPVGTHQYFLGYWLLDRDGKNYVLTGSSAPLTVVVTKHEHSWTYALKKGTADTITAKCTAEGCYLTDKLGGTFTISAPAADTLTYDGSAKEAAAKLDAVSGVTSLPTVGGITYAQNGTALTPAPVDAGEYTASITVGEGGKAVTASVKYTIQRADPKASDFTFAAPSPLTYDGNAKTATVEPNTGINGMGAVTVKYFKNGAETEPKDAGDYTVKVSVAEGANYNATTDNLTTDGWKFTIGKATQTIIVPTDKTIVKDGIAEDISDWATVAGVTGGSNLGTLSYALDDQTPEGVSLTGNQLTVQPTCTATQFTIKVTAAETDNYNAAEETFTVIVVDKATADVTITGLPGTVTYGQEFTLAASQTGDTTSANKKWIWVYDQEYFKLVGPNANTETITLRAIKAGTPSKGITATYESGTHKGSATVNPSVTQKEVIVSGITAANKEYDGNTDAMVNASGATITGIVSGDSLTITATGSFADADVGNGKAVNLTLGALSGASTGNYKLAASGNQTTATANITAKDVSISAATVNDKGYDGNANATVASVTITGVSGALSMGTDFDVTSATFLDADADTANVDVTINVALKGTAANNYNLTNGMGYVVTSAAKINKAPYSGPAPTKTVNILKNYADVQTGTLTAADFFTTTPAEAKITAAVPTSTPSSMMSIAGADTSSGNFTYASKTNITAASDESWTITISSKNYTDITATLTFSPVDRTDAGVTISSVPASKTYGESFTLTASVTDAGTGTGGWTWTSNDPSVLQVTGTGASATVKALKAGSATISAKYESDTTMGEQTTAPITVGKRVITVTADNKSMTVNGTLPTFTVTYGNLPSGVQAADIFGTLASASTTTDGKTTGSFDITVTTPVLKTEAGANYEVGAVTKGTLTVNPRSSSGGGGGGSSHSSSYTITVDKTENGTITVSPKFASKGDTVTITVKPDKGYELEMLKALDKDGDALKLTEKNGKYTFTMPAGKVKVKVTFMDDNTMLNYFVDVKAGDYFYDAVKWAAEKGITSGTDATHFTPNAACTRAQIVTFLWRAAGSPEPKGTGNFADVPTDSYYAKAVAWAVENGITGGTGDGKFSPNATCTREQAVAFLYRASGSPAVSGGSAFNDVAANAYYADAVAWAEKNEITGGIGGGLFGSGNDCTRAQIVTFLYRTYQGK